MADVTVILNPTAALGRAARRWTELGPVVRGLGTGVEVLETGAPGHATDLATESRRRGRAMVVAAGGDGTAHEVVQGLLGADGDQGPCTFAYLPIGTGCDFARGLGLGDDPVGIARGLTAGEDVQVDVGRADFPAVDAPRYFLNAANVGLGPFVAHRVGRSRWLRRFGAPAYLIAAGVALLRARPVDISWTADRDGRHDEPILNLSVCNGPSFGGGMRPAPGATLDSGRLHVAIAGPMGMLDAFVQLPRLMGGSRLDHPAIRDFTCEALELEGGPSEVETDGEVQGSLPVHLQVMAGGLRVRLPRAAGGRSDRLPGAGA